MKRSKLISARCLIGVVTILLIATASQAQQDYKIKLVRPTRVGDEFVVTVNATISQSYVATVNGQDQPPQEEKFKARLHGMIKVLAINEKAGGITKLSCTVDKVTKDGAELYPTGTVINAEKTGQTATFTADGAAVKPEDAHVLEAVLLVESPDRKTGSDAAIGTDQPQKAGDTWKINPDKAAEDLTNQGLSISADDIKGESKLTEIKKVNDAEVMVITTHVTAENIRKDLPNGSSITDGKLSVDLSFELPTDGTSPMISNTNKLHLKMTLSSAGGDTAVVTTDRDVKTEREPAK